MQESFSISHTGRKSVVEEELRALEGPPTDSPVYAHHCHAMQHAIDFVSRCGPNEEITISVSGTARSVSLSFNAK